MYLSQVDIFGFKSFAKKTSIKFDDGITAIVGPNGCGKTNVVDAIRWVLGEQKASILRGDKMESVIFNGAATRKPLGLAEVTLIIENTKHILPSEYTEVEITRRLYRSGESEYLLNKQPCRLKDILDMFADTGMGADAYSIIELKMVESILSDRAEERRHMFDEAAGITRYIKRRDAALRRMQETERDLERIHDIVSEAERSVRSLKRQSKKSERYQTIIEKCNALEKDIWHWDLARVHAHLDPLTVALHAARREQTSNEGELVRNEASLEQLHTLGITMDKTLNATVQNFNEASDVLNAVQQKQMTLEHKLETVRDRMDILNREEKELTGKSAEGDTVITQGEKKLQEFSAQKETLATDFAASRETLSEFYEQYHQKKSTVDTLQAQLLDIIQQHASTSRAGEQRQKEIQDWDDRMGALDRRTGELTDFITQKNSRLEEQKTQWATLHAEQAQQHVARAALESEVAAGQQSMTACKEDLVRARSRQESRQARLDFLESFVRTGGAASSKGTQTLLSARQDVPGLHGAIGELIRVDTPYRRAIEAALGEQMNYLVCDTRSQAWEALQLLDTRQGGQATLIPLDIVANLNPPSTGGSDSALPPGTRLATDLVECDDAIRPVINFLLQDVLFVEDTRNALHNGRATCSVDATGRLEDSRGIIRGGLTDDDGDTSYLSVGAEIDRLQQEITQDDDTQNTLQRKLEETHRNLEAKQTLLDTRRQELTELDTRLHRLETEKQVTTFDVRKDENELTTLRAEQETLHQNTIDRSSVEATTAVIAQLEVEQAQQQTQLETLKAETDTLERQRQELERASHAKQLGLVDVENDYKSLRQSLGRLREQLDEYRQRIQRGIEEREHQQTARLTYESDSGGIAAESRAMVEKRDLVQTEMDTLRNSQALHRDKLTQLERTCKQGRETANQRREEIYKLELDLEGLKRDRLALEEKLGSATPPDLPTWEEGAFDLEAAKPELKNMRDSLTGYGQINFMALEQYREEADRLDHLTRQREDVLEAKGTLQETIDKINTQAREDFLTTFQLIRDNFVIIYQTLFEAGHASLELEPDVDPLEAKILVYAQPQGKQFQSIALLSAGEKALTAIALLLAIYKVKPSPFCILDEVDAPLDDANIDRFLKILEEFSKNTQFIIVTHNKRTMAAARYIYGVTQQEDGVSKVVSVNFT